MKFYRGELLDLNSNFIAKRCSKIGIKLCEIKIIPDSSREIIREVTRHQKNINMFLLQEVLVLLMTILQHLLLRKHLRKN